MINLLPPEVKQDYRYARRNRRLVQWSLALFGVIVGVGLITGTGLFVMNTSANTYREHIATTQKKLASDNVAEVQKQVTTISGDLKLMLAVLSKEILFSKLLERLGTLTPSDVVLTNLTISQTVSAIDVTAQTASYSAATQLQVNLSDPTNQLFSKADIVSITCASGNAATNTKYPCVATIRAQFTQNNPFLFINGGKAKAGV